MVRGFFAAAQVFFDPAVAQQVGALRCQEEVIDANPVVAVPGAGLIIPERVVSCLCLAGAEGLGVAQIEDATESRAALGPKQCVISLCVRACGILWLGNYVVVTAH